jgi:hypothetical protein
LRACGQSIDALPLPFFQKPTSNSGAVMVGLEPAAEFGFGGEEGGLGIVYFSHAAISNSPFS